MDTSLFAPLLSLSVAVLVMSKIARMTEAVTVRAAVLEHDALLATQAHAAAAHHSHLHRTALCARAALTASLWMCHGARHAALQRGCCVCVCTNTLRHCSEMADVEGDEVDGAARARAEMFLNLKAA
jgi:hypothetical protein